MSYNRNDIKEGNQILNEAAAREPAWDLLTGKEAVALVPGGLNEGDGEPTGWPASVAAVPRRRADRGGDAVRSWCGLLLQGGAGG